METFSDRLKLPSRDFLAKPEDANPERECDAQQRIGGADLNDYVSANPIWPTYSIESATGLSSRVPREASFR